MILSLTGPIKKWLSKAQREGESVCVCVMHSTIQWIPYFLLCYFCIFLCILFSCHAIMGTLASLAMNVNEIILGAFLA